MDALRVVRAEREDVAKMLEVFERLLDWAWWLFVAIGAAIMVDSLLNAPDVLDYVLAGVYFAIVLGLVALKALTRRRRGG